MPFITRHIRLTNSGKLPDIFLTAKSQNPTDLNDKKQGQLFFVLQINSPWSHAAPIGTSMINTVTREYYRQEGHVPLENFERAIAKANKLIEQLVREGETSCFEELHAIIALSVGDELHITYAGQAEAYFLREGKISLITDPHRSQSDASQAFTSIITGEVSADDVVLLGSPNLYSAITSEELETTLRQPLLEAGKAIARRLKSMRLRNANAIILQIDTLRNLESTPLPANQTETLYLDQAIDSTWHIVSYQASKLTKPILNLLGRTSRSLGKRTEKLAKHVTKKTQDAVILQAKILRDKTAQKSQDITESVNNNKPQLNNIFKNLFKKFQSSIPQLRPIATLENAGVPINYYGKRRSGSPLDKAIAVPLELIQALGKQFRKAVRRNPRTWYIVIALVLLTSIGASVQMRRNQSVINPVVPTASLEEMKQLLEDAKQAKAFGNQDKLRQLLSEAIAKGETAKQNPKLIAEASSLVGQAQRDLDMLAGASRVVSEKPLITLPVAPSQVAIYEGVIYFSANDDKLRSMRLTGGETATLVSLPNDESINQLVLDQQNKVLYIQSYTGSLYSYAIATKKFDSLVPAEGSPALSTGLGVFSNTLYLLDPAENQIWKHTLAGGDLSAATAYLKNKKANLADGVGISIDGSLFVMHKNGEVNKFTRGILADFKLAGIPAPFNVIDQALGFSAIEDGTVYYLSDRGNETIPPRIIEFDKTGRFTHQYFLPKKWQNDIKQIIGNPKSHKAWVIVNKDVHEFTLVQ